MTKVLLLMTLFSLNEEDTVYSYNSKMIELESQISLNDDVVQNFFYFLKKENLNEYSIDYLTNAKELFQLGKIIKLSFQNFLIENFDSINGLDEEDQRSEFIRDKKKNLKISISKLSLNERYKNTLVISVYDKRFNKYDSFLFSFTESNTLSICKISTVFLNDNFGLIMSPKLDFPVLRLEAYEFQSDLIIVNTPTYIDVGLVFFSDEGHLWKLNLN